MKGGGDADRRRGSTEPAEEAMQGLLGLWTSRLEAWGSCERYSGVRIAGCTPAARNHHGGRELTSGGAEAIPAEIRPGVERGVLGWLPGAEEELMRQFAGAWGRWSGESAAAQCSALLSGAGRRGS